MNFRHLGVGLAAALLCATVAPAVGGTPGWSSPADDSVTFRLNPGHTNSINFTGGFSPNLKLAWSTFSAPPNHFLEPIIANGTLFIVERVQAGTPGDILHALRLKDGHELWYRKLTAFIGDGFAAPAYDNGMVFVEDSNAVVHAFNAANGKKLWQAKLKKQYNAYTTPVVGGGHVFVMADGNIHYSSLYSLDEATGNALWSAKLNYGGQGTPAFDGANGVYVAPPCNYYRFNTETGRKDWYTKPFDCHGGGGLTPVYLHDLVFIQDVIDPLRIHFFDAETGREKGGFPVTWGLSPAFYTDDDGLDHGITLCCDNYETLTNWLVSTKKAVWTYTPGSGDTFQAAPIVINGIVFVSDGKHDIIALDAGTGAVLNTISPTLNCEGHECSPGLELAAGDGALAVSDLGELFVYVPK